MDDDNYFHADKTRSVQENRHFRRSKAGEDGEEDSDDGDTEIPYRKPSSIYLRKDQITNPNQPFTPDTHITLPPKVPDITLYCKRCDEFVNLVFIQEHRKYHQSLDILKYNDTEPDDVEDLLKRRANLIKELRMNNTEDVLNPHQVQKINEAVEFLKSDLEQTYVTLRRQFEFINTDVEAVSLNCSPPCIQAVGICSSQNERWKKSMEDARVFQDYFGNDVNKSFFGIYDGHNGRFAAEVCANKLHQLVLQEITKFDPMTSCTCTFNMCECNDISQYETDRPTTSSSERVRLHEESTNVIHQIIHTCEDNLNNMVLQELQNVANSEKIIEKILQKSRQSARDPYSQKMEIAFRKAYHATDHYLTYGLDEQSKVRWSGCSAISVLIDNLKGDESSGINTDTINDEDQSCDKDSSIEPPQQLGKIYVANTGNSHAVLVRDKKAYQLSKDHTPKNKKEWNRVIKTGVTISDSEKELRVKGILATTRGLGNHGDIKLKKAVISDPSTKSVQLDQYAQVLIIATDGVWQVLSDQDAADIVSQLLPSNMIQAPSQVSSSLNPLLQEYSLFLQRQQKEKFDSELTALQEDIVYNDENGTNLEKAADTVAVGMLETTTILPEKEKEDDVDSDGSVILAEEPSLLDKRPDTGISDDMFDKKTEVGSRFGDDDNEDSGNEGDIETLTELSMPAVQVSNRSLTKEEIHREFAKAMAERLVQAALLAGSKDNITVMVVLLSGSGL